MDKKDKSTRASRPVWKISPADRYFQARLKQLVDERGWTQEELARQLGRFYGRARLATQTGHEMLQLKQQPTLERIYVLSLLFAVPMSFFILGSGDNDITDERDAMMWSQLSDEQKNTIRYLEESFIKANNEKKIAKMEAETGYVGEGGDEDEIHLQGSLEGSLERQLLTEQ